MPLDQNLGSFQTNGNATTLPLTTSATAAAGSRIFVGIAWFGVQTISSVADNSGLSLNWVEEIDSGLNNVGVGLYSAHAPAGLPSGTVITVTWSAGTDARSMGAFSWLGALGGSTGYQTGTPAGGNAFGGTPWATPSITPGVPDALLVSVAAADSAAGATGTVTAPAVEVNDTFNATTTFELITGYKVVNSTASTTIAGTWGTAPGEARRSIVGFKLNVDAPPTRPVNPWNPLMHRFRPGRSSVLPPTFLQYRAEDSSGPQSATVAGRTSVSTFGTITVLKGNANVTVPGRTSVSSFGAIQTNVRFGVSGRTSVSTFGTITPATGNTNKAVSGRTSVSTFGAITVATGNTNKVVPGRTSVSTFGTITVATGNVNVPVSGRTSVSTFGTVTITTGNVNVAVSGRTSTSSYGTITAEVEGSDAQSVSVSGRTSTSSYGTITLTTGNVNVAVDGRTSVSTFGSIGTLGGVESAFRFAWSNIRRWN